MFSACPTSSTDFFCSSEYATGVGVGVRGDERQAGGRGGRGRLRGGEVRQERLGALLVVGVGRHAEAVDGGVDRAGADVRVDLREGEEVDVVLVVRELLVEERAQDVQAGLVLLQRLRGLLPGAAERVGLVVGQQLAPLVEDRP